MTGKLSKFLMFFIKSCAYSSLVKRRDISPTFLSNDLFYGVDANGVSNDNPAERFLTQAKLA